MLPSFGSATCTDATRKCHPADEYAYLWTNWQGGPVLGGDIAAWPLRTAPAGLFPAGTGTIASPFNGMCVAAADGTAVVAWKCGPGAVSQQWTGYSDGTLRNGGRCLDVTGPAVGAKVKLAACDGAVSQKWSTAQVSAMSDCAAPASPKMPGTDYDHAGGAAVLAEYPGRRPGGRTPSGPAIAGFPGGPAHRELAAWTWPRGGTGAHGQRHH
jgi:Ricin-type beta-trefoil lectin domain